MVSGEHSYRLEGLVRDEDGRASHAAQAQAVRSQAHGVLLSPLPLLRSAPGLLPRHGRRPEEDAAARRRSPAARRPNPGHMPLDLALRTIDEAAALGMEELQLSGGDPLLYPHLVEVIRAAKKHPGRVRADELGGDRGHGRTRPARSSTPAWARGTSPSTPSTPPCTSGCAACRGALPVIMKAIDDRPARPGLAFPGFRFNYMTVITRHNFRGLPGAAGPLRGHRGRRRST